MNTIKRAFIGVSSAVVSIFIFTTLLFCGVILNEGAVHAAKCGDATMLGDGANIQMLTPWYKYLDCEKIDGKTAVVIDDSNGGWAAAAPLVGMAIVELLVKIAGVIAVGFVVWGGIQYITSQGEPSGISSAKSTILNAVIGLIVSLIAVGIVQFVAGLLG